MYSYVFSFLKKTNIFDWFSIEKNICDDPSLSSGVLPCTGQFEMGVDSGNQCICQCQSGFTNTSAGCTGRKWYREEFQRKYTNNFSLNSIKCYMQWYNEYLW